MQKKKKLMAAFDREFAVLLDYYTQKAKKNKKYKSTLKLFTAIEKKKKDSDEADVDNNALRLQTRKLNLIDEFFYNVCFAYYGWQLRLYLIQKTHLPGNAKATKLIRQALSLDNFAQDRLFNLNNTVIDNQIMFPIKLLPEENEIMHVATKRLHFGLQNCFEGTK